jgi:predicted PurR-regulated permease PerM
MSTNELIPVLALVTLGAFLAVAVGLFVNFLRKRRNRQAAAKALTE